MRIAVLCALLALTSCGSNLPPYTLSAIPRGMVYAPPSSPTPQTTRCQWLGIAPYQQLLCSTQ